MKGIIRKPLPIEIDIGKVAGMSPMMVRYYGFRMLEELKLERTVSRVELQTLWGKLNSAWWRGRSR